MQEIYISNPAVVTGICNPSKPQAWHHLSLKLGSNLKYLNINQLLLLQGSKFGSSESAHPIRIYGLVG